MYLCFSHSSEFENRIPSANAQVIRQNHDNIKKEFTNNDRFLPRAIQSYLNLILIDLIRNQHYSSHSPHDNPNQMSIMLSVYDYIEQHLCEEITLKQLAEIASLTPNYFSYLFKKLNGVSLCNYINAKRIEKASRLLISGNSDLTMLEIATKCGFNNTANFNKSFKKCKGFTPSELKHNPKLLWH
jgi:AraC-like DNA-binding protein